MEHTHFSPLIGSDEHSDREHRVLGRIFGRGRQETGGKAESQPESKKDSAEETGKKKADEVKERKDKFTKRITELESRIQKLSGKEETKDIAEKIRKLKEALEQSLETVEKEIKGVEDSVTALVKKFEEGSESEKYNERRLAVLTQLRNLASTQDTTAEIKKVAETYIASLKDPETQTTAYGTQITEALVQKPQDLKSAEEFVKDPKTFVEKQKKQNESSNKSDQTVDTAREEAFTKGREEARKTFDQRVFDAVKEGDWQFIKEGEGASKTKDSPTLYRKVTVTGEGGNETYLVSYNPQEQSSIGIYIYDPKKSEWGRYPQQLIDKILSVVGTDIGTMYQSKLMEMQANGDYGPTNEQNDRNRVIGDYVRSGKLSAFNPKADAWQGNEEILAKISESLASVDRKEAQELDVIAGKIQELTYDIVTTNGSLPEVESSITTINALLKTASPKTIKAVSGFSVDGFVKPNPNSPFDYKYVRVSYKDGALVIARDEKKSNEYNDKVTKLLSAKSRVDQAINTHDEGKIREAIQKLRDMIKDADQATKQLDPFELHGSYTRGENTIRFSLTYTKGEVSMFEDALKPEQQKQFQALLGERFGKDVAVALGEKENSYVITIPSQDIEKVFAYAEKRGMNPVVENGKVTVTVTSFDARLKFTGPGFRAMDKESFERGMQVWRPTGKVTEKALQVYTADLNRMVRSLTQEAYDEAKKVVLPYSNGTISFIGDKFVFTPKEKKDSSSGSEEATKMKVESAPTSVADKPTTETTNQASVDSQSEGDPRDILESRVLGSHREWYDGTTVNRGSGKNEYVLSNTNPEIAKKVVEKAEIHGLRPRGNKGTDITVTITGYKEGFGFTGPDYKEVPDKPTSPDTSTPDKLSTGTQRPATEKPAPSTSETVEKSRVIITSEGYELHIDDPEAVTRHLEYRFLQKYTKEMPTDKDQAYSNTTVGPIGKDAQGNNIYRISGYESNPDAKRTMERLLGKAKKHGLVPPDAKVSDAHQFDITVTGYERGFGYTGPYPRQEFPDKPTETTVERPAEKVEPPKTAPATQPVEQPKKDLQQSPTSVSKQTAKPSETGGEMKKPESTPASVSPSTAQRNTPMDTPKVPDASAPQSPRTRTETNTGVTTPTAVKPERMPEYRASSLPPKPVEEPGEKRIVAPGKILAKEAKVKREAVTKAIIEQQRASLEAQGWKYNPADDSYSVDSKGSFRVRYNPKKECWEIRENGGRYDYLQQWKKPDGTNVFSPIYKKTAEGIQAMNRALILTPTQIDQATGTEIDPQTNITSEELDGLRRDLVHLQSVRENREKDYDATYQSSRGIVDALIAEIEHIRQNPALIREKVVTQEQYDELIDKAKVYSDRNNMLVEMTKSMPDTKEKVVTSISAIHEALMKRIDEMIRVREQDMLKKSDELKNSSLFQSWHQGLTGSSPLQIEIDTLNSEVTNLRSVKRQMQYGGIKEDGPITRKDISEKIEKARKNQNEENLPGSRVLDRQLKQDIEASARENVGATLDSLLRIRTLLQTINKVDADAGRKYEEDLEGIEVSKDVAVAIITLPAGAGGKATTLAGRVVSGARIGGLVSGSMSVKENYEEVQAGRKTVEQAVKGVAQDTTVGVGGGAVGGAIGHGLSKVKLPTRSPVTPGSAPVAPTGLRPVPPGPRGTTVTVESIKTNPRPPKIAGNLEGPPSKPRLTYREGAPVAPEQPQPKLREPATKKTTDGPKTDTPKTPKEQPRSAPKTTEKPATGPTPQRQEILKLETPKDAPIEILDLKTGKEIMGYNATGDIEIGKPLKIKVGSTSGKVETTKIVRKIVVEADGTMKITAGEGAGAETYQIMKMRRNHPSKGKAPERTSKPTTETEKTAKKESTKPDPKSQTKPPDDTPPPAGASPSPKGPETGPKSGGSGSKGGGGSPEKKSPTKGPTKKEPSSPKQTNSGPSNKGPEIVDAKLVALDPTKQVPSSGNMTLAEYLGVPSTADDKTVRTALTRMAGKVKNPDGSVVNSPQAKENWKIISKLLDSAKGSRANGKGSTISRKPPLSAQATLSQFIAL